MFNIQKIKDRNSFFISGEDTYLSDYYISKISDYFSIDRRQRKTFFLKIDSDNSLLSELSNYDLFSTKKLIVVNDISRLSTKSRNDFFELQSSNTKDLYIIVVEYDSAKNLSIIKKLKKDWQTFDARVPFQRDMKKWVKHFCAEKNIIINTSQIDIFTDLYGNNIAEVMNEIEKAVIYSKSNDITKYIELVDKQNSLNNYAIWQLVDSIGNKNKKKSIIIGTSLINKRISLQRITNSLFNLFISIEQMRNGRSGLMGRFYLNRFLSNNLSRYSSNFSEQQLSKVFFNLRKIDYLSKNTSTKDIVLLEEFIINACSS